MWPTICRKQSLKIKIFSCCFFAKFCKKFHIKNQTPAKSLYSAPSVDMTESSMGSAGDGNDLYFDNINVSISERLHVIFPTHK